MKGGSLESNGARVRRLVSTDISSLVTYLLHVLHKQSNKILVQVTDKVYKMNIKIFISF